MLIRFGPNAFDDLIESLNKMRQIESVEKEYKSKFKAISNNFSGLSDKSPPTGQIWC